MKIIVTGAAGFIGFHLSKKLLENNHEVYGIDNINSYYDTGLKLDRLEILKSYGAFSFKKIDLVDLPSLRKSFSFFDPEIIVNLAAQAGVRYSIENPYAYLNSNLTGFLNVIEMCRERKIGLIYASSSSVYGLNKEIPFIEDQKTEKPIALYGATKKANELIAHSYSHLYNLNTTGLRFFTVYGPWGRPDMAMFIFTKKIIEGQPIPVYNNGKMKRDFTYIDDIVSGTMSCIDKNYECEVFNLGNHRSEKLMDMIGMIEDELGKKAIIDFQPIQPGDVKESFADISKAEKYLGFKPTTNINIGIKKFISWYKKYYKV